MPIMNGFEATRIIREEHQNQDTVIIALSASALDEERSRILAGGFNDFILKPFREAELYNAMQTHLGLAFSYEEPIKEVLSLESEEIHTKLQTIPEGLLSKLEGALELSVMSAIDALISDISSHDELLARSLKVLADNFEYDRILEFIKDLPKGTT